MATTDNVKDDVLVDSIKNLPVTIYRGSEQNVLERFVKAAEVNQIDYVVRVCADNPFLDVNSIIEILKENQKSKADYTAWFFDNGLPSIKSHSGRFAEGVSLDTLKRIQTQTDENLYLEHVTNYIYAHSNLFSIERIKIQNQDFYSSIRLTVDTESDFQLTKELYQEYKTKQLTTEIDFQNLVLSRPDLMLTMKKNIENNGK